ncbi:MAG: UbiA family prenyltransferase [Xanthomonadales bacterium]|nr:UbiA family prenyltransferase [Xanthomonadales bacterium]
MTDADVPLCVDLDGTLIHSDLTVESILALLRRNPLYLFVMPLWLASGLARFKREVARRVEIDVTRLPYDARVLDWLRSAGAGRTRVLCTASDQVFADAVAAHLGCFEEALGSDGRRNLGGHGKAAMLRERFGDRSFDYAGNARVDLHVWREARQVIVANAPAALARRVRRELEIDREFPPRPRGWRTWLTALRPHQWLKNTLVFVPLLAAHAVFEEAALAHALLAFAAFSLCASAAYVLNDLLDLDADRRHPRKRNRPFASGGLPLRGGLAASLVLTTAAFALATTLSLEFVGMLLAYAVLTLAYSLILKRIAMLDVVTLAGLYTIRILGGAVAVPVPASSWLLAFSMFLFLSLAMVKRHAELRPLAASGSVAVAGRGYVADDLPLVQSLGTASGYLSVLVLALYINSAASLALYAHPAVLWLLAPVLLYWISRVWLLAGRGAMHDDPVVFALTDRVSLAVLAVFALVIWLAI